MATPRVDAVVLAGTHQDKSRLINGTNKAFLPLGDSLSLHFVLEALRQSDRVDQVFVVGPSQDLQHHFPTDRHDYRLVEEKGRMLDNAFEAYRTAEASVRPNYHGSNSADRLYLFLTSDIPLTVPQAIADFVNRSVLLEQRRGERIDFFAGVADEVALAPFYPHPRRRGIFRPYMELKHQRLRLANIYLARPARIRNLEVLQQGFAARKLTQWRSVARLITTFLGIPAGLRGAGHVAWFQAAYVFDKAGLPRLSKLARNRLDRGIIEQTASRMLGCRFAALVTPYGGLSLDIDELSDYEIIRENLVPWREHQKALLPSFPEEAPSADRPARQAEHPPAPASQPGSSRPREPVN
ncbi:MAG: NTP transferase domain-containing protein [Acidobacteria bacterium]|nr:NTP transferase domain-containing protein [Acidobacteriota bacterium]